MSCVSDSRMAPVSGSARLSTSVPRSPRDAFLMTSTAEGGPFFGSTDAGAAAGGSRTSVDIAQIPSVGSEIGHPGLGVIGIHAALLRDNAQQRGVHVRRHGRRIAAYI